MTQIPWWFSAHQGVNVSSDVGNQNLGSFLLKMCPLQITWLLVLEGCLLGCRSKHGFPTKFSNSMCFNIYMMGI